MSKKKYPSIAECKVFTNGNIYGAVILQKICHYSANPIRKIDGHYYTAPTTKMLSNELGIAGSTIHRAVSKMAENGVIKIVHRHFKRSPRRYIRIVAPLMQSDKEDHIEMTSPTSEGATVGVDSVSPSQGGSMHIKSNKKNNIENNGCAEGTPFPEKGQTPENGACEVNSSFLISEDKKSPQPSPRKLKKQIQTTVSDLLGAREPAEKLANRRGWTKYQGRNWAEKLALRRARERSRLRQQNNSVTH